MRRVKKKKHIIEDQGVKQDLRVETLQDNLVKVMTQLYGLVLHMYSFILERRSLECCQ
jgi:hypothetical protein